MEIGALLPQDSVLHLAPELIALSRSHFIVTAFPSSRAKSYAAAVLIAKMAETYAERMLGTKLYHIAAFGRSGEQGACAADLARRLSTVSYVQHYIAGKAARTDRVANVLECYGDALACEDHRGHCHVIVRHTDVYDTEERDLASLEDLGIAIELPSRRYIFPCDFLRRHQLQLEADLPVSAPHQIQAQAVKFGCHWCPLFDAGQFKEIPA